MSQRPTQEGLALWVFPKSRSRIGPGSRSDPHLPEVLATEEPRHRGHADRVLGDVALIYAGTTCIKADGQSSSRRYTDVWAKQVGRWCDNEAQGLVPFDLAGALWQDRSAR